MQTHPQMNSAVDNERWTFIPTPKTYEEHLEQQKAFMAAKNQSAQLQATTPAGTAYTNPGVASIPNPIFTPASMAHKATTLENPTPRVVTSGSRSFTANLPPSVSQAHGGIPSFFPQSSLGETAPSGSPASIQTTTGGGKRKLSETDLSTHDQPRKRPDTQPALAPLNKRQVRSVRKSTGQRAAPNVQPQITQPTSGASGPLTSSTQIHHAEQVDGNSRSLSDGVAALEDTMREQLEQFLGRGT